jgi:hypothetical protein
MLAALVGVRVIGLRSEHVARQTVLHFKNSGKRPPAELLLLFITIIETTNQAEHL